MLLTRVKTIVKILTLHNLSNIPGAFLMSLCGTYRACTLLNLPFLPSILTWNMALIFSCLSLVTTTSMVVNDYFDARSGTDLVNLEKGGESFRFKNIKMNVDA